MDGSRRRTRREKRLTVAHRTLDNGKKALARADAPVLAEDDVADMAEDESEDDLAGQAAPPPADEPDEDLRVVPSASISGSVVPAGRPTGHGNGIIDRLLSNPVTRFPTESGLELWSKVTWPEPRYAWNMTLVVIGMSIFVAVILGAADLGLSQFVTWVISHAGATPVATPTPAAPAIPGQP